MSKKEKVSPVLQLMADVWDNCCTGTPHAWERTNHSMSAALRLAIGSGFKFEDDDFKTILDGRFSHGYWISESSEWCYSISITEGNYTAAKSYENYKNRMAFIADDVTPSNVSSPSFAHLTSTRQKERLHVGASFQWKGERVNVTSFAADGESLTACSYHERKEGSYENKIKRRHKITREDIIADRADRKQRSGVFEELTQLATADETGATRRHILDVPGIKDMAGFAALPLKKIRAVLDKIKATMEKPQ